MLWKPDSTLLSVGCLLDTVGNQEVMAQRVRTGWTVSASLPGGSPGNDGADIPCSLGPADIRLLGWVAWLESSQSQESINGGRAVDLPKASPR